MFEKDLPFSSRPCVGNTSVPSAIVCHDLVLVPLLLLTNFSKISWVTPGLAIIGIFTIRKLACLLYIEPACVPLSLRW
jgi:hypothetical protein